jgi:hydrogenase expression/formation protein HypE
MTRSDDFNLQCPVPIQDQELIGLAHGGGGRAMNRLLENLIVPAFENPHLAARHDGAVLEFGKTRIALSTDSYVVRPMFFPGGDIGKLAVYGTANDVAMCGARPRYLSVGLVLEEGTPLATLERVVASLSAAAAHAGVQIVTGDTKVVDRGKGDQIFINTTGVGSIEHDRSILPASVRPGDAVLLSGDIGRHGMAIMAVREGLAFESEIESDCAPLAGMVLALLENDIDVHCLRDCTRGGVVSALVEVAQSARCDIQIEEAAVPVRDDVAAACEIFGLDPLYVANEGRFVAFVPAAQAERAVAILLCDPAGKGATCLGYVGEASKGRVTLRSALGTSRILDMLNGEQLPRIC